MYIQCDQLVENVKKQNLPWKARKLKMLNIKNKLNIGFMKSIPNLVLKQDHKTWAAAPTFLLFCFCFFTFMCLLVVCLCTNGERALNYTIVKRLIYLQTLNYSRVFKLRIIYHNIITVKAFNAIVTNPCNCLNWKKAKLSWHVI